MNISLIRSRALMLAGMLTAAGVLLPMLFHSLGLGQAFLPMHIPALMAGLLLPWPYALCAGALMPLLSALTTGMPPLFPVAPLMMLELGAYALCGSLLSRKALWKPIPALLVSMAVGRVVAALAAFALVQTFDAPLPPTPWAYLASTVGTGLPGIALQLALIPPLWYAIRRLLPAKA